jgi:hypothetical protein
MGPVSLAKAMVANYDEIEIRLGGKIPQRDEQGAIVRDKTTGQVLYYSGNTPLTNTPLEGPILYHALPQHPEKG